MNSLVINHLVKANLHAQFVARGLKAPAAYAKTKVHAADAIKLFHAKLKEHAPGDRDATAHAMRDVMAWARTL